MWKTLAAAAKPAANRGSAYRLADACFNGSFRNVESPEGMTIFARPGERATIPAASPHKVAASTA